MQTAEQKTNVETAGRGGFVFLKTDLQIKIDWLIGAMAKGETVELPLVHRFTPGLYIREIFMPKGALVVSRIHKTEHPFVVSKGHAAVWIEGVGVKQIKAPYCGITKPGTRRILFIHEDCIWTTFHPTDKTDPDEIVAEVTFDPEREPALEVDASMVSQLANRF